MAKKHANKKPKKKGKIIKMSNDTKDKTTKEEPKKLSPQEAMDKLIESFKSGNSEERENILFNMCMRMGSALDGLNARLDMLAGIVYKIDGVQEIVTQLNEQRQKEMEAAKAAADQAKNKEGEDNGTEPKQDSEPELSKEGAASESK